MKKNTQLISLFSLIIIFSFIVSGCTDDKNEILAENTINYGDINSIGEDHNKGLDFIYHKPKESLSNFSSTKSRKEVGIYQLTENATKQFMQNYKLNADIKKLIYTQIEKDFSTQNQTPKSKQHKVICLTKK